MIFNCWSQIKFCRKQKEIFWNLIKNNKIKSKSFQNQMHKKIFSHQIIIVMSNFQKITLLLKSIIQVDFQKKIRRMCPLFQSQHKILNLIFKIPNPNLTTQMAKTIKLNQIRLNKSQISTSDIRIYLLKIKVKILQIHFKDHKKIKLRVKRVRMILTQTQRLIKSQGSYFKTQMQIQTSCFSNILKK